MISCCLDNSLESKIYYYDFEIKEIIFNQPMFCTIAVCDDLSTSHRGSLDVVELMCIDDIGIIRFENNKIVFYTGYLKSIAEFKHEFPVQLKSYDVIVSENLDDDYDNSIIVCLNSFNVHQKIIYNPRNDVYRVLYPGIK